MVERLIHNRSVVSSTLTIAKVENFEEKFERGKRRRERDSEEESPKRRKEKQNASTME
jgi:hypothetical protein